MAEARDRLGGLEVLVANAGVLRMQSLVEEEVEAFRGVIEVNLLGVFLSFRAAARLFREQRRGVILATASQAGRHGYASLGAYCASKFGVVGLVEVLAKELGPFGVRVNCVAPGLIRPTCTTWSSRTPAGRSTTTSRCGGSASLPR